MKLKEYEYAKEMYDRGEFSACIEYIDERLYTECPKLCDFLLRSKCYFELGDIEKGVSFPWNLIDYKYPEQVDFEALELIERYFSLNGDALARCRFHNRIEYMKGKYNHSRRLELEREKQEKVFGKDALNLNELLEYARYLFMEDDIVKSAYYHSIYLKNSDGKQMAEYEFDYLMYHLKRAKNVELIYKMMLGDSTDTIAFVVDDANDYDIYFNMAKACKYLGKKAYFITAPIDWEVDEEPAPEESLKLSYDAMEEIEGVTVTTSINYIKNGEVVDSTLLLLLDDMSKKAKGNQLLLFAEKNVFRTMQSKHIKRMILHYVATNEVYTGIPYETNFGYINGYENFYSEIYKVNVIEEIKKESKHAFSIVIPVRNNINTLSSTLKTCLEQDFNDYEILISDNSDDDNQNIPNLLHTCFDSEKIRYIKTPRVLPLTKSFEYANLKAEGDFLIPLGADDGILFGGLNKLNEVVTGLEKREKINILSWDRIHYVWPSLNDGIQESQFVIPRNYCKDKCEIEKREGLPYLSMILQNLNLKYSLPLSYINSGMKREYLYTLLEKTGAIIDGHSQDLYTGIANLAINEYYYHVRYPITIAALSNNSSGAKSAKGLVSQEIGNAREREFFASNGLYPVQRDSEDLFRVSDGDTANLLTQVIRLIDMECVPKWLINIINWEQIGKYILMEMNYNDINRPQVQKHLLKSIGIFSKETSLNLAKFIELRDECEKKRKKIVGKNYFKGFSENGGLHLDASEFGVEDVYGACELFRKICNIY